MQRALSEHEHGAGHRVLSIPVQDTWSRTGQAACESVTAQPQIGHKHNRAHGDGTVKMPRSRTAVLFEFLPRMKELATAVQQLCVLCYRLHLSTWRRLHTLKLQL